MLIKEEQVTKLDILKETLKSGEIELDQGEGVDGETFMDEMINLCTNTFYGNYLFFMLNEQRK
jgi:hypothetical protein